MDKVRHRAGAPSSEPSVNLERWFRAVDSSTLLAVEALLKPKKCNALNSEALLGLRQL